MPSRAVLPVRTVVACLWAAPVTVVGLVLGAAGLGGGACVRRERGVLEFTGGRVLPRLLAVLGPRIRVEALTLGHVVLARSRAAMEANRDHERVHVRQYERWGLFFPALYLGASALAWARGGRPYRDNRFERAAFEGEEERRVAAGRAAARGRRGPHDALQDDSLSHT